MKLNIETGRPAKIIIRFLSGVVYASCFFIKLQGWQSISAAGLRTEADIVMNDAAGQIIKGPFNLLLEHAMADYRHYYLPISSDDICGTCCFVDSQKHFDISLNPFFKYEHIDQSAQSIFEYGGFIRAQFNLNRFWVRAYDLIGQVDERQDLQSVKKITGSDVVELDETAIGKLRECESKKALGADDVILKVGYDFCRDNDKHFGLYLLGGFPTNRNLSVQAICLNDVDFALFIDSPAMGGKNFSIGGGANGAYALYDCKEDHVALLFDAQYSYAVPATYTEDFVCDGKTVHVITKFKPLGSDDWSARPRLITDVPGYETVKAYIKSTPGSIIAGWSALHLSHGNCNVEIGGTFRLNFAPKTTLHADDGTVFREALNWLVPSTLFVLQPYLAISGCAPVGTYPVEAGFGISYEYSGLLDRIRLNTLERKISGFQGLVLWGSFAVSF